MSQLLEIFCGGCGSRREARDVLRRSARVRHRRGAADHLGALQSPAMVTTSVIAAAFGDDGLEELLGYFVEAKAFVLSPAQIGRARLHDAPAATPRSRRRPRPPRSPPEGEEVKDPGAPAPAPAAGAGQAAAGPVTAEGLAKARSISRRDDSRDDALGASADEAHLSRLAESQARMSVKRRRARRSGRRERRASARRARCSRRTRAPAASGRAARPGAEAAAAADRSSRGRAVARGRARLLQARAARAGRVGGEAGARPKRRAQTAARGEKRGRRRQRDARARPRGPAAHGRRV